MHGPGLAACIATALLAGHAVHAQKSMLSDLPPAVRPADMSVYLE
jgi:hypothetical protein